MKKALLISLILIFILLINKSYSLINFATQVKSSESDIQLYCGYWMIHPILSNWNNYNWLEKKNYQSFFQNILASYKFIAIPKQNILIYLDPNFLEYSEDLDFISQQLIKIIDNLSKLGWKLNNDHIRSPYQLIIYIIPMNLSANIIPIDPRLFNDQYEGVPIIIINSKSLNKIKNNPCILTHAIAHLIIQSTKEINSIWFLEALSSWMETLINDNCENIEAFFKYRIKHPELSLDYADPIIGIADSHFINLINSKNNSLINNLFNQKFSFSNPLSEINRILKASSESSLKDLYEEYALANFYQAYSANIIDESPISHFPYSNFISLQPYSSQYFIFNNLNDNAVKISYENDNSLIWIFIPSKQFGPNFRPLNEKNKEYIIPISSDENFYIITINPTEEKSNIKIQIDLVLDYPIKLGEFKTQISKGEISLIWNTLQEIDTLGWFIYKKREQDTNFIQLNSVPIPAAGNSNTSIRYIYIDKNVISNETYQYFLTIITKNHFFKKGPIITVKLP